jgi:chromosome segregation ATPase
MTTPATARLHRHAARAAHLRQELADERLKFRLYMRVHQQDIVEVKEAWERITATEDRMWRAEAAAAMHRDQVRRLQRENDLLRAQRDALEKQIDNMTGEL